MRRKFKSKQITRHTKVSEDGIQFASKLELYMYRQLKKENIKNIYEGKTFQIIEGCHFDMDSWEKTKGSKQLADRGNKKLLGIKYTPDFIDVQDPPRFIIETKGNPNESFPIRWKLFKMHLMKENINTKLFMPRNQKDCDQVVAYLKNIL
tara:strand:+ start:111 stop:560 length:450 start_codon:yes stop_codon:yes gene_type:complete